jgi:TonB family C-terminal domain
LGDQIKYPLRAKESGISGRVVLNFEMDNEGRVDNIKIVKFPPNGTDLANEAYRVVSGIPRWRPGWHNGKPVKVSYSLSIEFSLKK